MGTIKYYNPKTDRYQTAKILGINGNEVNCLNVSANYEYKESLDRLRWLIEKGNQDNPDKPLIVLNVKDIDYKETKPLFKVGQIVILTTSTEQLPFYKVKSVKFCSTFEDENLKVWHYELTNKKGQQHSAVMVEEEYLQKPKNAQNLLETYFN